MEASVGGRHRQHGGGIGSGGLEDDEAEVHKARDPKLEIQADAGHAVHAGIHRQREEIVELAGRHQPAGPRAPILERSPCGRRIMTSTRIAKATTDLY